MQPLGLTPLARGPDRDSVRGRLPAHRRAGRRPAPPHRASSRTGRSGWGWSRDAPDAAGQRATLPTPGWQPMRISLLPGEVQNRQFRVSYLPSASSPLVTCTSSGSPPTRTGRGPPSRSATSSWTSVTGPPAFGSGPRPRWAIHRLLRRGPGPHRHRGCEDPAPQSSRKRLSGKVRAHRPDRGHRSDADLR